MLISDIPPGRFLSDYRYRRGLEIQQNTDRSLTGTPSSLVRRRRKNLVWTSTIDSARAALWGLMLMRRRYIVRVIRPCASVNKIPNEGRQCYRLRMISRRVVAALEIHPALRIGLCRRLSSDTLRAPAGMTKPYSHLSLATHRPRFNTLRPHSGTSMHKFWYFCKR